MASDAAPSLAGALPSSATRPRSIYELSGWVFFSKLLEPYFYLIEINGPAGFLSKDPKPIATASVAGRCVLDIAHRARPQGRGGEHLALKRQRKPELSCRMCPAQRGTLCGALMKGPGLIAEEQQYPIRQSAYIATPGEIIYYKDGVPTDIFALCRGWAMRFVQLTDGRRQNLSVLLPGDLCVAALFQEKLHYSVEALTDVRITRFGRDHLKKRILGNPSLLEIVGRACAAEQRDIDERAADLGRRSAEERVAHLILSLVSRISAHWLRPNQQYAFPLLQRHIADLTGLTSVHVSRVMSEFRTGGIMKLARGILTIANPTELERIARLA